MFTFDPQGAPGMRDQNVPMREDTRLPLRDDTAEVGQGRGHQEGLLNEVRLENFTSYGQ